MSPPEFDPISQLAVLNRHGVRYVVLGGFAAVAHGSPLPTSDVDVTPARDTDNLRRLSASLMELGARVRVEGVEGGLPFSHSAESLGDVDVPLAALADVIASKEAAGRPQDRAALPILRRLAERLGNDQRG